MLDPALEDALLAGLPVGEEAEPLRELVDALLPAVDEGIAVWMAVRDDGTARRLARSRPGTRFIPKHDLPGLCAEVSWEAALIDLDAAASLGRGEDVASASLDGLGLSVTAERNVVLWGDAGEGALEYEALADAMLQQLWLDGVTQRIYGLYQPPMAAVVDFGESLEVDGAESDLEITLSVHPSELRGEAEEDDEVPLYFDNSLGAQEPGLDLLLGVCSGATLPEGLGLVELPAAAAGQPSGLRAQLVSAQARAQRAEIERQTLLDRLDALQRENRELRERVEAGPDPFDALARDEALEASMAREQALKWKVSGLEHQLSQAIARPVEALEAEVARLSATQPAEGTAGEDTAAADVGAEGTAGEDTPSAGTATDATAAGATATEATAAGATATEATAAGATATEATAAGATATEATAAGPTATATEATAAGATPAEATAAEADDAPAAVSGDFEAPDAPASDDAPRGAAPASEPDSMVLLVRDEARDEALSASLRRLVKRLERGGIGVLALRRELSAVARRLRTR